jgi:hypothetical protein
LALEEIAAIFGDADEIFQAHDIVKETVDLNGKSEHSESV